MGPWEPPCWLGRWSTQGPSHWTLEMGKKNRRRDSEAVEKMGNNSLIIVDMGSLGNFRYLFSFRYISTIKFYKAYITKLYTVAKTPFHIFYDLLAVFCSGRTGMPVCPELRQHRWAVKADAPSIGKQAVAAGPTVSLWTTWKDALSGLMPGSVCCYSLNIQRALIVLHPPTRSLHHPFTRSLSLCLPLLIFLLNMQMCFAYVKLQPK